MARIRTVKPEYPKHRKVRRVSRDARLLNIHLWNLADDEGRLQELPRWIIGEVFPADDDVTPAVLDGWLSELADVGLIIRYEVEGELYIACHGFTDHQAINKPRPSELPAPPDNPKPSRTAPVALPEDSHGEGNGTGNGRETTPTSPNGDGSGQDKETSGDQASRTPAPARIVFDAWVEATGRDPTRTKLTDKRRRLIRRALDDYPDEDLVDAVRGWRHSPHHRGENDRHEVYNDIELLLRDAKQIEKFRDLERRSRNGSSRDAAAKRKRLEGVR